jgi:DNA-binding beta-propeller fold protein YncE
MRPFLRLLLAGVLLGGLPAVLAATLELVQTIPLAVNGRIDHLSVDVPGQRLFVAALGNHSLEVVNLATGAVRSVGKLGKPQGVAYLAKQHRLFVSDGDRALVTALDSDTLAEVQRIEGLNDADNLRYDAAADRLYAGYGEGGIRVIDPRSASNRAEIKLQAHPEGFAIGENGRRLYVNVPDAGVIAVIDTQANAVAQSWRTLDMRANFPLILDEGDRRVYVGTRRPPHVLVHDTESGRRVAAVPIGGDVDDIFFDREAARLYAICGEGFIDVIRKSDRDHYEREDRIATRAGARTGLFVPELRRLFVAVPSQSGKQAEIGVYARR